MCLALGVYSIMSSQGIAERSCNGGSSAGFNGWSDVFVLCAAAGAAGVGFEFGVAIVGVAVWCASWMSCVIVLGVLLGCCIGMLGQVVAKQRGCHDSPQLLVLRTRHSRPVRLALQVRQQGLRPGGLTGCISV